MKCNINRASTDNALYKPDIYAIAQGLELLEEDIRGFLKAGKFDQVSEENAQQNLEALLSAREQLKQPQQNFSVNELKAIYVGLNFLLADMKKPEAERSRFEQGLTAAQMTQKRRDVELTHQKITAAFSRMGIDIQTAMRGF